MRKLYISALATALAVGSALPAVAQLPVRLGISAGVSTPSSDLSDYAKAGFAVTGNVSFKPPLVPLTFQVEAGLNRWGLKDAITEGAEEVVDDAHARVVNVSANVLYDIPSVVIRPYLLGGLGWYRFTGAANVNNDVTVSTSENKLGFSVGAGVRLPLGRIEAVAEARYSRTKAFDEAIAFIPITIGIRF